MGKYNSVEFQYVKFTLTYDGNINLLVCIMQRPLVISIQMNMLFEKNNLVINVLFLEQSYFLCSLTQIIFFLRTKFSI